MKSYLVALAIAVTSLATAAETGPTNGPFRRVFQQQSVPFVEAVQRASTPAPVAPPFKVETSPAPVPAVAENVTIEIAQQSSEVDTAEVIRRGDRVTRSGVGPMGTVEQLIGEATAPPPDDSNKWFITIIVDDGRDSQALLYDLKHSDKLRAWANPDEPKESWSHLNIYRRDDEKQSYRWKSIKIEALPVMLLQPPAKLRDESKKDSWIYGPPSTVVWQFNGYPASNPNRAEIRRDDINKALKSYCAKIAGKQIQAVSPIPTSDRPTPGARAQDDTPGPRQNDVGVNPPFSLPTTPVTPVAPVFPADPTLPTPAVSPSSVPGLTDLLSLGFKFLMSFASPAYLGVILLALIAAIQLEKSIRDYRRGHGMKLIIPDELQSVIDSFQEIVQSMMKNGPPANQNQNQPPSQTTNQK